MKIMITWISGELAPLVLPVQPLGVSHVMCLHTDSMKQNLEKFAAYLAKYFDQVKFIPVSLPTEFSSLRGELETRLQQALADHQLVGAECTVNLTGGTKLMTLLLDSIAARLGWRRFYITGQSEILWFDDGTTEHLPNHTIEQRIYLKGGDMIASGGSFLEQDCIKNLVTQSRTRPSAIAEFRDVLLFMRATYGIFNIHSNRLKIYLKSQLKFYGKPINRPSRSKFEALKQYGFFDQVGDGIQGDLMINFSSFEAKDLFFNEGIWLELYTYQEMLRLQEEGVVRDLHVSVKFMWDRNFVGPLAVPNEIDIMFVHAKSGQIGAISCKTGGNIERNATKTIHEIKQLVQKLNGDYGLPAIAVDSDVESKPGMMARAKSEHVQVFSIASGDLYTQLKNWLTN